MRTARRIEGLRELEAALANLPKATGKSVLRRVLRKAATPIEDSAEANAPTLTGGLQSRIVTGTRLTRRQAQMVKREGKSDAEIHVGTADPAGIQTEFGNAHQAAEPWLRPAWDENKEGALDTIAGELGQEIDKAAKRVARKAARAGRG
jgi:HK97 gp10 family phage protein